MPGLGIRHRLPGSPAALGTPDIPRAPRAPDNLGNLVVPDVPHNLDAPDTPEPRQPRAVRRQARVEVEGPRGHREMGSLAVNQPTAAQRQVWLPLAPVEAERRAQHQPPVGRQAGPPMEEIARPRPGPRAARLVEDHEGSSLDISYRVTRGAAAGARGHSTGRAGGPSAARLVRAPSLALVTCNHVAMHMCTNRHLAPP